MDHLSNHFTEDSDLNHVRNHMKSLHQNQQGSHYSMFDDMADFDMEMDFSEEQMYSQGKAAIEITYSCVVYPWQTAVVAVLVCYFRYRVRNEV